MTLVEWGALVGAVCAVVTLAGGAIYIRGKRDGRSDERDVQSGEDQRNGVLSLGKLAAEAMDRDRRVTRLEEGFGRHESGCEKAARDAKENAERVDRETKASLRRIEDLIEARYANLSQQILNIAKGEAGTFRQVLPPQT